MSSANARPRRTNANLHPGKILLDQKTPRRSSAEVAQERAAMEAERQKLLKKQEAAMKALADLEAKLLESQEQSQQEAACRPAVGQSARKAARPASQPQVSTSSKKIAAAAGAGQPQAQKPTGRKTGAASGRATAEEGIPASGRATTEEDTPPTPVKKAAQSAKRIQKLTRADFEAYRDARKTEMAKQKENVEPVAGRKRTVVEEDSLSDGSGEKDIEITTPPAKKGRTTRTTATCPLSPHRSHSTSISTSSSAQSASPPAPTDDPASKNSSAVTTETDPEAGIVEEFGGYGEEETDEQVQADRRDLQHSQGLGKGDRTTAQSLVQMQSVDVANVTAPAHKQTNKFNAEDGGNQSLKALQPILGETIGRFTYLFIPKLLNTIGNSASGPWRLYGFDLVGAMKAHAVQVWPDIDIDISPRHAFHDLAKQKISDYRAVMGTEAIEVVSKYMMSRRFSGRDERKEWVEWALNPKSFPFRYEKVLKTADGEKKYGIYQHKFILQTLAYHLKRIQMPVEQIKDYPCNALALATTAVERALRAWETGEFKKPRGEAGKFSDRNWGRSASEYLATITNLSDAKWDTILKKAEQYARGLVDDSDDDESDYGDYDASDIPGNSGRATMEDCDDSEQEDVDMGVDE